MDKISMRLLGLNFKSDNTTKPIFQEPFSRRHFSEHRFKCILLHVRNVYLIDKSLNNP